MLLRAIGVFGLVVLTLAVLGSACGVPLGSGSTTTEQSAADAQATHVRRTALAEVQRIIANPRQPTSTPQPTGIPRPACANGIWWHEARGHVNEVRAVQGRVVASRPTTGGQSLIEIGQPYPDPLGVSVVAPVATAQALVGRDVCVTGRITVDSDSPTIEIRGPQSITVTQ